MRASTLGTVTKSCVRLKEGAPKNQAPPDGSRWLSVGKDATGARAAAPWVDQALERRHNASTVLDKPFRGDATAALRNPAKAAAATRAPPKEPDDWRSFVDRTYA